MPDCALAAFKFWQNFLSIRILCNATRYFVLTLDKISSKANVYFLCDYSKLEHEPQRRRALERRAFVAHKLLLLQPQQVAVVRLGSLCSSSHTAKNFAFIFDIQAPVRLFLLSGSPCVRSTSDCAVLLATLGAQSAVARLSADLYCKRPVCRSLLATN